MEPTHVVKPHSNVHILSFILLYQWICQELPIVRSLFHVFRQTGGMGGKERGEWREGGRERERGRERR